MEIKEKVLAICSAAKDASRGYSILNASRKNDILKAIRDALDSRKDEIIAANTLDLDAAEGNGIPTPMLDRLMLNEARIDGICSSLDALISLRDPVG